MQEDGMLQVTAMPLGVLDTNCYIVHTEREATVIDPGGRGRNPVFFGQEQVDPDHDPEHTSPFRPYPGQCRPGRRHRRASAGQPQGRLSAGDRIGGRRHDGLSTYPCFFVHPPRRGRADFSWRGLPRPGHTWSQPGQPVLLFCRNRFCFCRRPAFLPVRRPYGLSRQLREGPPALRADQDFSLPEATVVYPGHGPETTVGAERLNNPFFTEFIR